MQTIEQFKSEQRVDKIILMQGKGRKFSNINGKSVIVATNADMAKPLFVAWNDKGFYVIMNASAKVVGEL